MVEFLNAKMPDLEVLAVEIKQFHGAATQTLVPRVIERIENQSGMDKRPSSPALTRESFLAALPNDQVRVTASRLLDVAEKTGGSLQWRPRSVTIKASCSASRQPVSVAWLWVPGGHWRFQSEFTFGSVLSETWPTDPTLRDLLVRWSGRFSGDDFTKAVRKNWVVSYEAASEHADLLEDRLTTVLSELREL